MSEEPARGPRLSVVVPTCNRPAALGGCLDGLARQSLPSAAQEVIVVDDSGSPSAALASLEHLGIPDLRVIRHERNAGAAAARNSGARAASAPFLAFIDDDCVPESGWASELVRLLRTCNGAALAGRVLVSQPEQATDRVTQLLSDPLDAADGSLVRAQSANLVVPADGFAAVGGFDEMYRRAGYEDYDFCLRWRASGRRILAAPEAIVIHRRGTDLRRFWQQHFRNGRGAALLYRRRPAGVRPPVGSSLARMWRVIGSGTSLRERLRHTGLVGLSQVAMLVGLAAEMMAGVSRGTGR